MIISYGFGNHLADAADKSIVQQGDDQTSVPPTLIPIVRIMSPTLDRSSAAVEPANTSFATAREVLRAASTIATADVIAILARGLWVINWTMASGFQTNTFVAASEAHHKFKIVFPVNAQVVAAMYRGTNCQNQSGQFRLLARQTTTLRLDMVATGASDAQSCVVAIQAEKLI